MKKTQVKDLLERAFWAATWGFSTSLLVLLPGVLAAPNLKAAQALFTSALISALSGAASALKTFIKQTV